MYVCMYNYMYVCKLLLLALAVVFGLELAVDYLYSEPERAVSP